MSTQTIPRGTPFLTDEQMAQIRRDADAAWETSERPVSTSPMIDGELRAPAEPAKFSPVIAVFEMNPDAPLDQLPPDDLRQGTQPLPDNWFERFLSACGWMAHDLAASLRDANRRESCAKVRQVNNELACKALVEAATIADVHCRFLELASAQRRASREPHKSEAGSAVGV